MVLGSIISIWLLVEIVVLTFVSGVLFFLLGRFLGRLSTKLSILESELANNYKHLTMDFVHIEQSVADLRNFSVNMEQRIAGFRDDVSNLHSEIGDLCNKLKTPPTTN